MRVAIISLHFAEYALRLAKALAPRHQVMLCLSRRNANREATRELQANCSACVDIDFIYHPHRTMILLHGLKLTAEMLSFRPDVIHIQETHAAAPVLALRFINWSVPVVLTVHDPFPHSGADTAAASVSEKWRRMLRDRADRVIVHGDSLVRMWSEADPSVHNKLVSIAHGVLGESDPLVERELPPVFLFFGRVERYKGLQVLLDAAECLAAKGVLFRVVIAGVGTDLARHRSRISSLPFIELIDRFISPEELRTLFGRATAIVLPYTDATQSGIVPMAFAAGRPVIATKVGGLPDYVHQGYNGILIEPHDDFGLAQAMVALIEDCDLYARLRTGAMRTAVSKLSWELIAAETAAVYEEAITLRANRLPLFA